MQMLAQINNKKTHWIVSATLLLATLCTVVFVVFSPVATPKAHAGMLEDGIFWASEKVEGSVPWKISEVLTNSTGRRGEVVSGATDFVVNKVFGQIFELIGRLLFWISGFFLMLATWILDVSISQSLDSNLISKITSINTGWGIVRDVCNMFFIFILLYISLATILQATTFNWKKTLGNLIIAALLINFSLFFTKVIIDVSNMFAITFYNSMTTDVGGETIYGPASILKSGLGLDTVFDTENKKVPIGAVPIELEHMSRGIILFLGTIFQMIAGFVFFAGAFIFIKRTIAFIFLMIVSPIGFVGFVLPATQKYSKMWWSAITENAIIAPVYLFMLFLVCSIIRSGDLLKLNHSDDTSLAIAAMGKTDNFAIFLNFFVLIGLIWGALVIAQAVSEKTASSSIRFAGKMTGGMLAGGAMAGRQVGGRAGRMITESNHFKKLAESKNRFAKGAGSMILQGGDAAAKSSWDVRNTKMGDAAIGGTLGTLSSGKVGSNVVGAGKDRGKGGIVAAEEARGKTRNARDERLGNILATDKYGKFRKVKDPITGEEMTARELHSKRLERRAENFEPDAEEPAFAQKLFTSPRKYLARHDAIADKKAAKLVGKGDKETRDAIKAEGISAIEKSLEEAIGKGDFEGTKKIMGDLTSDQIKDMDREILVKPEVAINLDIGGLKTLQKTATGSEREQIRNSVESFVKDDAVIAVNPEGQSLVAGKKAKRTAQWLNSARGGEEF